jgi:hypothetical protein
MHGPPLAHPPTKPFPPPLAAADINQQVAELEARLAGRGLVDVAPGEEGRIRQQIEALLRSRGWVSFSPSVRGFRKLSRLQACAGSVSCVALVMWS